MCCPKRFDTKPWAFACAYTTLLLYMTSFLLFIPFVFHKGIFDQYVPIQDINNPLNYMANMGSTMYALICFMCFGSLFVALLSVLCIIGIQKERSGFLIPYLIVKSIITLIVVVGSFFIFHLLRITDEAQAYMDQYSAVSQVGITSELLTVTKALTVLMVLVAYWVFITPIIVVSTHCHRVMHGTANAYQGASLIAMEAPAAHEIPVYHYAVKPVGAI